VQLCISSVGVCIVWCCTLCVDICVAIYIVYVYVIEEKKKELGVCWLWQPIWCMYEKDKGLVLLFYFNFIVHVIYDSDL